MRSSAFVFALAGAAAAETVNMMLPFADDQHLLAKSIGGNADATTYVLGCEAGTDSSDCGYPVPQVIIQGPKTMAYHVKVDADMGEEGDFSYEQDTWCSLDGTTKADCTYSGDGPLFTNTAAAGDGTPPPKSGKSILTGTDLDGVFQKVTIVTDTASILGYGTGMDGKPTSYEGAAKAIMTGAAETGMVTSKASLPTQTGAASGTVKSLESVVSSKTEAAGSSASAAASSVAEGFAAQVTGLGAAAFAAVAGVMAMAAL